MVADFNKKQNRDFFSEKFWFRAAGILFMVIALLLVVADFKMYQKKKELDAKVSDYKKQIGQIEKRNTTLKEEIANSDNPNYIEKIARNEEGMQKPGEKVVSFVMPVRPKKTTEKTENFWNGENWLGWLSQSWSWIKSKF